MPGGCVLRTDCCNYIIKEECYKQEQKNDKVRNDSKRVSYTQHISYSRKI